MTTRVQIINGVAYPVLIPLTPTDEHINDSTIHVTQINKNTWDDGIITLGNIQPIIGFWFKEI